MHRRHLSSVRQTLSILDSGHLFYTLLYLYHGVFGVVGMTTASLIFGPGSRPRQFMGGRHGLSCIRICSFQIPTVHAGLQVMSGTSLPRVSSCCCAEYPNRSDGPTERIEPLYPFIFSLLDQVDRRPHICWFWELR